MSTGSRLAVPAAATALAVLAAAGLGLVPPLRFAWATNLWQYLPLPLSLLLAAATLALCWPPARRALVARLPRDVAERVLPGGALGTAALAIVAAVVLWLLRERRMYGDSNILLYNAAAGSAFLFPDIGATFLFQLCQRIATALGTSGQAVLQVAVAIAGGATVALFARIARTLAPDAGRALLLLLLVLGGGLARVLAGHVEVYAFVLLCAAVYFRTALACIDDDGPPWAPALAFGVGLWMHLSFSFLAPSLLLVVVLSCKGELGALVPTVLRAAVVAALPVTVFLVAMGALGHTAELAQALETLKRWGGLEPSPVGHEAFLRGPFAASGAGTRYAILSAGHVKYLANAFFVLAPASLPVLACFLLLAPSRFLASRDVVFLGVASGFLVLYALVVRPVWGPYDWDLFSLTALSLATLAATLLVRTLGDPPLRELGVVLVAGTLLVVTLPFVAIGIAPRHAAGPFAYGVESAPGESPVDAFERNLGPWL
jgi:hypothetical protein